MEKDYTKAIERAAYVTDNWLPMKIRYDKTPGLSVCIVHKGKIVYKSGFGYADVETEKPATAQILYRVASISKMFTAVSILQLVARGKLNLDDSVSKHISWFKGKNKTGDFADVTIRHILSHSSGLFRDGMTPHWSDGTFPESLKTTAQKAIVNETLESYKYSNYAFSLLGAVIEKASGVPYETYVKRNIIAKLGLKNTYPDLPPKLKSKQLATGYSREIPDRSQFAYKQFPTYAFAPATGVTSNVTDLAKFMSTFAATAERNTLLPKRLRKEMMRPHAEVEGSDRYGLGMGVYDDVKGRRIVGHAGGFLGFSTQALFSPKEDLGVIVLANSEGANAQGISFGILELIYHFVDKADAYKGRAISRARYEGIYRSRFNDTLVQQVGSKLILVVVEVNKPTRALFQLAPTKRKDEFVIHGDENDDENGELVRFSHFKNGKAQKISLGAMRAERYE